MEDAKIQPVRGISLQNAADRTSQTKFSLSAQFNLTMPARQHAVLAEASAAVSLEACERTFAFAKALTEDGIASAAPFIRSTHLGLKTISIKLDRSALAAQLKFAEDDLRVELDQIKVQFASRRRGVEMKIVAGELKPEPDASMVRDRRNAHRWADMVKSGTSLDDIARTEKMSDGYVRRIVPLATLSPRLHEAIIIGTQPLDLTLETLVRSKNPIGFDDQERLFGMQA